MAGFQTASVGNITVQRGRPSTPVVDVARVNPALMQTVISVVPRPAAAPRDPKLRKFTRITTTMVRQMRERRAAGESIDALAKAFGVADTSIRRHTKDVPPPEGGWSRGGQPTKVSLEAVLRMRRAGFTYKEIGENFGIDGGSIWRQTNKSCRRDERAVQNKRLVRALGRVSAASGFGRDDLKKRAGVHCSRSRDLARARHIVFWCLVRKNKLSLITVARQMGGFDHTSVLHGVRRVDDVIAANGLRATKHPLELVAEIWAADWTARTAR